MKCLFFPLLLIMMISCSQKESYVFVTEEELQKVLLKDPVYINFKSAQQAFIEGIMYNKLNANQEVKMDRQELRKVRSLEESKEIYRKAGMDQNFLDAFDKWYKAKMQVRGKYRTVIQHQPQLFKKVADANAKAPSPDVEKIKAIYSNKYNHQKKETVK